MRGRRRRRRQFVVKKMFNKARFGSQQNWQRYFIKLLYCTVLYYIVYILLNPGRVLVIIISQSPYDPDPPD